MLNVRAFILTAIVSDLRDVVVLWYRLTHQLSKKSMLIASESVCKKSKDGHIHLVESSHFKYKLLLVSKCRGAWNIAAINLGLINTGQGVEHLSAGCQPSWITPYGDKREQMMWVTSRQARERTAIVAWDPEAQSVGKFMMMMLRGGTSTFRV